MRAPVTQSKGASMELQGLNGAYSKNIKTSADQLFDGQAGGWGEEPEFSQPLLLFPNNWWTSLGYLCQAFLCKGCTQAALAVEYRGEHPTQALYVLRVPLQ